MGVNTGYDKIICPKCGVDDSSEKVIYHGGDFAYCKNCKSTFSRVILSKTPEIKKDDPVFVKCPNCNFPSYRIRGKKTYNCRGCKSTFINNDANELENSNPKKNQIANENPSPHLDEIAKTEKKIHSKSNVDRVQYKEPTTIRHNTNDKLVCQRCGSSNLHADKKGFSGGNALIGGLLTGGIGLLAGTVGSNDIKITCLKCGAKFNPGDFVEREPDSEGVSILKGIWLLICLGFFIWMLVKCN